MTSKTLQDKLQELFLGGEDYLHLALRHPRCGLPNNQRMELLGDTVINLLVTEILYQRYPDIEEGELSARRAFLVSNKNLGNLARELKLDEAIDFGPPEDYKIQTLRVLGDCLEAVFGALYSYRNLDICRDFLQDIMASQFLRLESFSVQEIQDSKTQLNIFLTQRQLQPAKYELLTPAGPNKSAEVRAYVPGSDEIVKAEGANRREAEQRAASELLRQLKNQTDD